MDVLRIQKELKNGVKIDDMKLRVTYYARVSTGKDTQANSFEGQAITYEARIKNNSNWIYVDGYKDKGKSGKTIKGRIEFKKMLEDAKANKFDLIITKEVSRFSRSTIDSLMYTKELMENGVGVLFESQNLLSIDPDKKTFFTIISALGEEEVKMTSQRVKRGLKMAINNNRSVLGNDNIWGYRKKKIEENGISRSVLEIDEEEAKLVRLIYDLYVFDGMGMRSICNELTLRGYKNSNGNEFSFSTIKGILTNPKYKGTYCAGRTEKLDVMSEKIIRKKKSEWIIDEEISSDIIPAIVDKEIWHKANAILQQRHEKMSVEDKTSYQNKYAYSGKIICMKHNKRYHRSMYRYKSGNREVWQCKEYYEKGKKGCDSPILYTNELDEVMRTAIQAVIRDQQSIIDKLLDLYSHDDLEEVRQDKIKNLLKEKAAAEKRLKRARELLLNGTFDESEYLEIKDELSGINDQLEVMDKENCKDVDVKKEIDKLKAFIKDELNFCDGINNQVVDSLLDHIEVSHLVEMNNIRIKVFFKVLGDGGIDYEIKRSKTVGASVCCLSYI